MSGIVNNHNAPLQGHVQPIAAAQVQQGNILVRAFDAWVTRPLVTLIFHPVTERVAGCFEECMDPDLPVKDRFIGLLKSPFNLNSLVNDVLEESSYPIVANILKDALVSFVCRQTISDESVRTTLVDKVIPPIVQSCIENGIQCGTDNLYNFLNEYNYLESFRDYYNEFAIDHYNAAEILEGAEVHNALSVVRYLLVAKTSAEFTHIIFQKKS